MTRADFHSHAAHVPVTINGNQFNAMPKEFSTKSLGWNVNGKMDVLINGEPVRVQIGLNLTVVGSKEMQ